TFALDYTVGQADVDAGSVENSASATGVPPGGDPDDPTEGGDTAIVEIDADPGITVVKTGSLPVDAEGAVGDVITYEFVITNSGNVTLTDLTFTDAFLGASSIPGNAQWVDGSIT